MDVKGITHICDSPSTQAQNEARASRAAAAYLIVVEGGIPGTMLHLSEEGTSLGRSTENAFQFYDVTVSRHHAFVWMDARGDVYLSDLDSTNGTFLNGGRVGPRRAQRLTDGDRVQLGSGVVLKLVRLDPCDERFQREMFERTVRDALTGLYNRSYFLNQIAALRWTHVAQGIGLAVLMLDVDHFKRVNDRYGHLAGDAVLRDVAAVIRESTRSEDLVARYGGEEFVVALPVSTPERATERAERIRANQVARRILAGGQEIRVSVSIGLAFGPPGRMRDELTLIERADQALYQAKAAGRNRIAFAWPGASPDSQVTRSAELCTSSGPWAVAKG
jgi:diguanylate cyclase (GGDEF)-like protein